MVLAELIANRKSILPPQPTGPPKSGTGPELLPSGGRSSAGADVELVVLVLVLVFVLVLVLVLYDDDDDGSLVEITSPPAAAKPVVADGVPHAERGSARSTCRWWWRLIYCILYPWRENG